jgi:hypothetical protein
MSDETREQRETADRDEPARRAQRGIAGRTGEDTDLQISEVVVGDSASDE